MKLSEKMQTLITRWPLGFVASIDADGRPAVSPKGTFIVVNSEQIAFSNIRSPQTIANLRARPACEVNFIDLFVRKGARVSGQARIIEPETAEFAALSPRFEAVWPTLIHRMKAFVIIDVQKASPFATPLYDDGISESEMVADMKAKFAALYP